MLITGGTNVADTGAQVPECALLLYARADRLVNKQGIEQVNRRASESGWASERMSGWMDLYEISNFAQKPVETFFSHVMNPPQIGVNFSGE